MQQGDSAAFHGYRGESFVDCAVCGFAEPFLEEFVVAVVVAEDADQFAVLLFEFWDNEARNVVASVKY